MICALTFMYWGKTVISPLRKQHTVSHGRSRLCIGERTSFLPYITAHCITRALAFMYWGKTGISPLRKQHTASHGVLAFMYWGFMYPLRADLSIPYPRKTDRSDLHPASIFLHSRYLIYPVYENRMRPAQQGRRRLPSYTCTS